jgi:hypothetical protein
MTMKSISYTIFIVALLGLLAYTNPTLDSYESYVHQQVIQEVKKESNNLDRALGYFIVGIASSVVTNQTVRKDYVFLSIYDTNIVNEHLKVLGILNNFFALEIPQSLKPKK